MLLLPHCNRLSTRWLLDACKAKLIPAVERLQREKDDYLQEAIGVMRSEMTRLVPLICQQVDACVCVCVCLCAVRILWLNVCDSLCQYALSVLTKGARKARTHMPARVCALVWK